MDEFFSEHIVWQKTCMQIKNIFKNILILIKFAIHFKFVL